MRRFLPVLVTSAAVAAGFEARTRLARRRRRLQLMPVGVTRAAGLSMRRSLRLSGLRELALLDPGGRRV